MSLKIYLFLVVVSVIRTNEVYAQFMSKEEASGIDALMEQVSANHKPGKYIFRNASILTMTDALITEQDVLVEDGLIKALGTDIENRGAMEIDGKGKYLMPGLTDMHIHLFQHHQMRNTWMLLLLINGVTSVRDMAGEPGKLVLRDRIRNNEVLAPNIYQAGPIINGVGNQPVQTIAASPEEGRKRVREQKELGYDFIKVYDDLNSETYFAILDEAQKLDMPVTGHVPTEINVADALNKQLTIEHLTGYRGWKDNVEAYLIAGADYAAISANSGTWNCPTLFNLLINWDKEMAEKVMSRQKILKLLPSKLLKRWEKLMKKNDLEKELLLNEYGKANRRLFNGIVSALYMANAKLIAGTDAGSLPLLVPGFSLHEELFALHDTGIPVADVLKMTTIYAALCMTKENEFGTVEPGKRADLLLLNSNPFEDLKNLNDRCGVMVRGIWLDVNELDRISEKIQKTFGEK